jgi:hypothetical protein
VRRYGATPRDDDRLKHLSSRRFNLSRKDTRLFLTDCLHAVVELDILRKDFMTRFDNLSSAFLNSAFLNSAIFLSSACSSASAF